MSPKRRLRPSTVGLVLLAAGVLVLVTMALRHGRPQAERIAVRTAAEPVETAPPAGLARAEPDPEPTPLATVTATPTADPSPTRVRVVPRPVRTGDNPSASSDPTSSPTPSQTPSPRPPATTASPSASPSPSATPTPSPTASGDAP